MKQIIVRRISDGWEWIITPRDGEPSTYRKGDEVVIKQGDLVEIRGPDGECDTYQLSRETMRRMSRNIRRSKTSTLIASDG